jgi:phosphate-selective porin OprO/OprP
MKLRLALLACTAITASALTAPAFASDKAEIERLERRVQQLEAMVNKMAKGGAAAPAAGGNAALEQRVQDLEISQGAKINALQQRADAVQWSFDNGRPIISTGDGRFTMAFRGRFHFDAGTYSQDPGPNVPTGSGDSNVRDLGAGSFFRRAHFGIEGKVFRDFDYEFRYNFGGSSEEGSGAIHTMRIAYNPTPEFRINVGAMQPTFTLDNSTSSNDIMFLERSAVTNALVEEFGASDSRKGIELTYLKTGLGGGTGDFMINAAYTTSRIGVRNAPADDRDHLLGRIAYHHKPNADIDLHIGANAATILGTGGQDDGATPGTTRFRDRPELRIDGARLVDTGNINSEGGFMYGVEAGVRYKSLTVQGEYFGWEIDRNRECPSCNAVAPDPEFDGYYVQASYILTGENRLYNAQSSGNSRMNFGAPRPSSPFSTGGTWGAFELAARYSVIDLNYNVSGEGIASSSSAGEIRGGKQSIVSAGLNWYLNRNIRFMFQYQNVDIERLNNAGTDIGQTFDSFAVRTQFAF